ncbi:unnamed protein product [Camellia sinensis]
MMCPMNGAEMWEQSGKELVFPPEYLKQPGRPRKARRREPDEGPKSQKPTKLRRFKKNLSCRKCGQKDHNIRICKSELQPSQDNTTAGESDVGTFTSQEPMLMRPPPAAVAKFASQGPMLRRPSPAATTFPSQPSMPIRPTLPAATTSITQASRLTRAAPARGGTSKKRGSTQ